MAKSRRPKGDGSIFRGGDGTWRARHWVTDPETGAQRQVQVRGKTKVEVSRKLAALRERVEAGQPARDEAIAFERYAERWLRTSLPASSRKQTTQILYAGLTRRHLIGSDLGQVSLDRLAPRHIEALLLALRAKGLSDSTVRQVYTIGRAIAEAAVRDGALARNPFTAVPRPRIARTEAPHLSVEQVQRLLDAASGSRYRLLFELMVNTGLRRGEALALRWADVDTERRTLFVRGTLVRLDGRLTVTEPKTTKARRVVPLSREALATLDRLRRRREDDRALVQGSWTDTGFVFTTQDGEPCEPRNALRALKAAARIAGLGDIGLHTLRHSAATVMLNHGVPINVVSSILGHSGIEVTVDIYGHVAPHVSLEAVTVLSNALSTAVSKASPRRAHRASPRTSWRRPRRIPRGIPRGIPRTTPRTVVRTRTQQPSRAPSRMPSPTSSNRSPGSTRGPWTRSSKRWSRPRTASTTAPTVTRDPLRSVLLELRVEFLLGCNCKPAASAGGRDRSESQTVLDTLRRARTGLETTATGDA